MKILVGRCFGLGNCIISIPMIKALATLGQVDVLVGSTSDDAGAVDVMTQLKGVIGTLYVDRVPLDIEYDVAVMTIPFDNRWHHGTHFNAKRTIDRRSRPDASSTGFESWKQHEIIYQMENAYELGFIGQTPPSSFYNGKTVGGNVYVGIGYKRDALGFWAQKHWGNERFASFMQRCVAKTACRVKFFGTGNLTDFVTCAKEITQKCPHFNFAVTSLSTAWATIESCDAYFGNDTGMMHAAASMGKPCYWLSNMPGAEIKSPPWGVRSSVRDFSASSDEIADDFLSWLGQRWWEI